VDGGFQMTKKLSKSQIKELEKNPNVILVNDHTITYHPDFKVKAVRENLKGTTPAQIFEEHGFPPDIIGKDIPRKRLYQWRQVYNELGELGLALNKRGKTNTHLSSSKQLSVEEKLKKEEQGLSS
jgi:transposase